MDTKHRLGIVPQDSRDRLLDETRALRSAATFLKDRMAGRRCDSDGVSDCERCKTNFLADRVLYALQQDIDLPERQPSPHRPPDPPKPPPGRKHS